LIFNLSKKRRVEDTSTGRFYTEWIVEGVKSVDEYLSEILSRHNLEIREGGLSKCGKHLAKITEDRETGKIYDEFVCMSFKDRKKWENFKKGKSVGEPLECLVLVEKERKGLARCSISKKLEKDEHFDEEVEEKDPP
jgi:23S rRNA U2552 (ribose-2'-O)-methylase RlmE/FtsJ